MAKTIVFTVWNTDDFYSQQQIGTDTIPLLGTIIENVKWLLLNRTRIRHAYLCILRQTTLDATPATPQEDQSLRSFFSVPLA
ncbi:hypothetical protein EW146_g504 [Bondarzewia mesenterica]|uniref:Uncharacterized protein n=1 Tax=Bondarzewia mesenterica TaxID=1095465 RepID=A0A4V3XGD3_9AGAM|nr:hypothetical protein EW146_g504 [Bondarzewia mesenterica]